ncbi:hypothetical protein KP509_1Z252600 [Ceratopteris richardii]|nr:hypothetical protein KP509_1Z252600 [Ceratopteris richardii]
MKTDHRVTSLATHFMLSFYRCQASFCLVGRINAMKLANLSIFVLMLSMQLPISYSAVNQQDLAALQAIQEAWAPTSFSWSGDPCESLWFGITCDQNGTSVIKLELPAQSLGGALPPQIGSLTSLQTLDLSYNTGIVGNLPSELFLLSNLVELFLQNCGLTGTIPDEIGNLRS